MELINNALNAPRPVGPYSQAVKSSGLIFCAGQIALDPKTGQLVEGGLEAQTMQVLDNLCAVLKASGANFNKVVMTTIYLTDIAQGPGVNKIYGKFANPDTPPARQTVVVKELPLGALVEISVIAEI